MSINWEEVLKTIGSSAVIVAVIGYFLKTAFAHFLVGDLEAFKARLKSDADRELKDHEAALKLAADQHMAALTARNQAALEDHKAGVAADTARAERVRQQIERWAVPISGAVDDLRARLHNIQHRNGYRGLDRQGTPPAGWRIGYDYFLPSSVFYFAQYFCWIRLLQESLTFELFAEADQDEFLKKVRGVGHQLSTWPLKDPPPGAVTDEDAQIFALQQRLLGDYMIVGEGRDGRCMRAGTFFERWPDAAFRARFQPIVTLLDGLTPDQALRWERLKRMDAALENLAELCRRVLAPADS